jgi:hypothetical protein
MTWSVPSLVEAPSVADLPFIRIKYERLPLGLPGETADDMSSNGYTDDEFAHDYFYNPASVAFEQASALELLSEETFNGICQAMSFSYHGKPIRCKEDLSTITAQNFESMNEGEEDDGHATFEQVMSYIFFKSTVGRDIRWDRIAELYNSSRESQQRAMVIYFDRCKCRDLLQLLSVRAPAIALPEALRSPFDEKNEDGHLFLRTDSDQRWLRDDLFMNQFEVVLMDSQNFRTLVATGPTLKIALAKAISYVRDSLDLMMSSITINRGREQIWRGKIVYTSGDNPKFPDRDPRIDWTQTPSMQKDVFNKTLYAVEKALNIQRSKVRHLEDDLGL